MASYKAYICVYIFHINPSKSCLHGIFIPNFVGIFVSGTYLAVKCEVVIAVSCVSACLQKMLGLYAHIA